MVMAGTRYTGRCWFSAGCGSVWAWMRRCAVSRQVLKSSSRWMRRPSRWCYTGCWIPGASGLPTAGWRPSTGPVLEVRILSVSITAILFALLVFILVYLIRRPETALHAEKKDREIGQKYRAMIVELNERPENNRGSIP
jgi:hypothetical protein